jgi:predicted alpha-1,2-mannosidase
MPLPGRATAAKAIAATSLCLLACGLAAAPASAGPAALVAPFAGTQPGPRTFGGGHNFPGAALPFGMVQFSPDTIPSDGHEGGYDYRDHHIKGFSVTHLSGAGCGLYGDFPFMPTTEPLNSSPAPHGAPGLGHRYQPGFSHAHESAAPGRYALRLNPAGGGAIHVGLTATTRTGLARIVFPSNPHSSVLINAGGSARPDDRASVSINPNTEEITGSASSGFFCAQRPRYRIYFAARFNRPFAAYGTWKRQDLTPGGTGAADHKQPTTVPARTAQAGAYATFDTRKNRVVSMRIGISFISAAAARSNLLAEGGGFAFGQVAGSASKRWNAALGRIRVGGGSRPLTRTFYTALYHALLAPRTFEDADGRYMGMDGRVHDSPGYTQYADFSGWDIYRSEIQLLSMIYPKRAGDMVRSLLAAAGETGCLPRWPYANGQSMTMVGDPSDPIIASAAAFGAFGFDPHAALDAMVRGATQHCSTENGEYVERQGLDSYLRLGYLPFDSDVKKRNANSLFGNPEAVWGSAASTLEYVTADFAIAQFAARYANDRGTYRAFMHRSGWWRRLFNPHSKKIEPRMAGGSFLRHYDNVRGSGFVEGNSYQYSWMIPHDPAGLFRRIGNRTAATRSLDYFLRRLNGSVGGTHTTHALMGNEPNSNVPWLYNWTRRPWKTQGAVRRSLLRLFAPGPAGYPGNDDLGQMSSWYVFGALGLYPEVPGVGLLAVSSPLFPRATVKLRGGTLRISAPGATAATRYIGGMRFNGHAYGRPWTTWCALAKGARLGFRLGKKPDFGWGDSVAALPASFGPQRPPPKHSCTP